MNNKVGSGCPQKICEGDELHWSALTVEHMLAHKERWYHWHVLCSAGVLWKPAHCRPLYIVRGPHNALNCNVWFLDFQLAWMLEVVLTTRLLMPIIWGSYTTLASSPLLHREKWVGSGARQPLHKHKTSGR